MSQPYRYTDLYSGKYFIIKKLETFADSQYM
jgi:hypothetical protein